MLSNSLAPDQPARMSYLARAGALVDLSAFRRVAGLLSGDGSTTAVGSGNDFHGYTVYQPGDPTSHIDWPATARSNQPIVRQHLEYRKRNIVLVVDSGRELSADSADGVSKRELVLLSAAALCRAAQDAGDRVSCWSGDSQGLSFLPARGSTGHFELLLSRIDHAISEQAAPGDPGKLLDAALRSARRDSLVCLLVNQDSLTPAHERVLRSLASRHQVLVLLISSFDLTDPAFFDRAVVDVFAGRSIPDFVRRSTTVRAQVRQQRAHAQAQQIVMLKAARIPFARIGSETDVAQAFTTVAHQVRSQGPGARYVS